jgi:hypothetical protein
MFTPPTIRAVWRQQFPTPADTSAMLDHDEPGDVNFCGAGAQDCWGMSVWVRLDRMQWDGEYLLVPYTFVHGVVLDCQDMNEGLDWDAPVVWVVDFGVQRIGELDYELIRPHQRKQGGDGEEGMLHSTAEDWAPLGEGAATNHMHYGWSRGRNQGRGGEEGSSGRGSDTGVRYCNAWCCNGKSEDRFSPMPAVRSSQRPRATILDPL